MASSQIKNQKTLKIEWVDIGKLKFADYNPRFISDSEYANLLKSMREHSLVQALIANSNPARYGILISGHQRLRAARELRLKKSLKNTKMETLNGMSITTAPNQETLTVRKAIYEKKNWLKPSSVCWRK